MNPGRSSVPSHEIDELANALRQHGILQPIVVHRADAAGRLAAPRPRLARPLQPTKQALARIAKEGRKYGVSLGLVSQRPSELAESILSQCNTIIALRMSNEQDQYFVQRALPDAVRSLVDVLPTLRAQEALVVGEGTAVPVRVRFSDLPEDRRPHSADVPFATLWKEDKADAAYVADIVRRWRHQERSVAGD